MAGIQNDGFSTTIAFALDTDVQFKVKELTPPGMSAGGAIDTTTMENTTFRTMFPKSLITLTESSILAAWDPALYDEIIAMLGKNQSIVVTFPDAQKLTFFGWIDEFTPNAQVEGEQPTTALTIVPSNVDLAGAEIAPVLS